ncbi:uncharacterized protein LOC141589667 [Silene latifolia]|uniref:uncharacterized protein LOC141589667 n=1 Tax=Silene latifolia TaxID=37657 RepID=UPI003D76DC52
MVDDENSTSQKPSLHTVYTVTNIQNKVCVLDGAKVSYASWVNLFTLHGRGYKVLNHIDDTPSPAKTDPLYDAWYEIDAHVLQWIYGTMSDDLLPRILEPDSTAQEAWNRVNDIFLNNKGARAASLENEFHTLKLGKFPSFDAYCQRLRGLSGQLKDVGAAISDQRLVLQLVRGLPKEYDTVAAYINQTMPNFETVCSMIELENHRQSSREESTALVAPSAPTSEPRAWDEAAPSSRNTKRHNGKCGNNKGGSTGGGSRHHSKNSNSTPSAPVMSASPWGPMPAWPWTPPPFPYPTYLGWNAPWQPWPAPAQSPRVTSARGNSRRPGFGFGQAHIVSDDGQQQQQPTDLAQAFAALQLQSVHQSPFYMDTGASSHLSADAGTFKFPLNSSTIKSIYVGNGARIPVHGSGHTTLTNPNRTLHLHNVLYTPNIIKNLISVRQFTKENNVSVEFDPRSFSVKDLANGNLILRSNSDDDLYPVSAESTTKSSEPSPNLVAFSSDVWHSRLGHPGANILNLLKSQSSIDCNKKSDNSLCHSCQISKHRRLPFYDSNSNTLAPFDIIHNDLWTSPITSKAGYKYYLIFIDNFTQFVWHVGIDCDETFSPVVKPTTIHTVISLATSRSWPIHQLDVKNAFLHGDLVETVFMHQPPGFVDPAALNHVCRLRKSLYGLKQASRAWYHRFATFIKTRGFTSSTCDQSLFIYKNGAHMAYLLIYVDDIVLTASSAHLLRQIISAFSSEFAMTDLGKLNHFLGIQVQRTGSGLFLSQTQYARDILTRANMGSCNPVSTPVESGAKLSSSAGPLIADSSL